MDHVFTKDFTGGDFVFMGAAHLAALLSIVLLNIYLLRYRAKNESDRAKIRWAMAIALWVNEIGWHIWNASIGQWNIQTMIPLHVCSVLVWLGGIMLVTKNYTIYEFAYFMGIGGALQALLTPDLGIYGFPHYRFFQTFISHGLIVTSAIYMSHFYWHEYLYVDRLFHQPGHRQQLHVRCPQTRNRQPSGCSACLALVHPMAGSHRHVELLDPLYSVYDQRLACENPGVQ